MLSVALLYLPSDIQIVGCELMPYLLLWRPDGSLTNEDGSEFAPIDGYYLRYKWEVYVVSIVGSFPAVVTNLLDLTRLDLHYYKLTGPIPPQVGEDFSAYYKSGCRLLKTKER